MTLPPTDTRVDDPDLPAADRLLGPAASDVAAQVVAEEGGTIRALTPTYASYRPGRRIIVSYEAEVGWPDGDVTDETIVAFARTGDPPSGSLPVEVEGTTVGLWILPDDPYLPGLEWALDHGFIRDLLDRLGAPPGPIEVNTRGYWPRNRAVVEVTTTPPRSKFLFRPGRGLAPAPVTRLLYLKVVEPGSAERIVRAHRELAGSLPVPACHEWFEEEGIIALEARPGRPLYDVVQEGAAAVPGPADLLALLERLGETSFDVERAETTRDVALRYAPVVKALVPEQAGRIDSLIERLGIDSDEPLVTIHGDFHEYQVLVEGAGISGLLDVDDVAPGHRIDDLATMVARFLSFAPFEDEGREQLERYARDLATAFGRVVDPEELHLRIGAVLFARATSPFRNQDLNWRAKTVRSLDIADEWLRRQVPAHG